MAKRKPLTFTDEDRQQLGHERYHHPHPRVQQRMEVLWLLSQGETHERAGRLSGTSRTTVYHYVQAFRNGGVAALREFDWIKPVSELVAHRETLEAEFREHPPHTVAQAAQQIEALTGIRRAPTQTRQFLRSLGMDWRRVGAVPTRPKKTGSSTCARKPLSSPTSCNLA